MYQLILIGLVIILFIYFNRISLNKYYIYNDNIKFFKIVECLENIDLTVDNIPPELQPYIFGLNIADIKKDPEMILDQFVMKNKYLQERYDDLFIFDVLDFNGAYFPTAHTDIEWNKVKNDGFQVWSLINNNEYTGNMFIFFNKYLYDKYYGTGISLRVYKNQIAVLKNCIKLNILKPLDVNTILELMPIDEFIRNTKKYYLDFKSGDTILFAKNVIHMSDHRKLNSTRHSFNFRVAFKEWNYENEGKELNISDSDCGYVNDKRLFNIGQLF
jgi:hypothetical protein